MISRVPFPKCRSGVIDLTIAGNPKNDGHQSPWQEAVAHEIIPVAHKSGCANEATTGLTLGLFVMLFQDVVFGPPCNHACRCGSKPAERLGYTPANDYLVKQTVLQQAELLPAAWINA